MMMTKPSIIILLIIAFLPYFALGNRKYVPDDYLTIQEAINNTNTFDSIIVRPGFYQENLVITNKVVRLFSEFIFTGDTSVINQTIIDGNQAARVIHVNNNNFQLCIIHGFTLQNGYSDWGAGIKCDEYATVRIENCRIRNNYSTNYGGGIATAGDSHVTIKYCDILNNIAQSEGGGIEVGNFSKVSISDCYIAANHTDIGGGIYNCTIPHALDYKFGLSVNRCIIAYNTAVSVGGGVANAWSPNEAKIVNTTFYNNQSSDYCEIYVWGGNSIRLANDIIFNDSALVKKVIGMASWWGANMQFDYCLVYGGLNTIHHADPSAVIIYSETNLDTLPGLADPSNGDFHLESTSPCIDLGIDSIMIPPHVVQPGEVIRICIGHDFQNAPVGSTIAGDTLVNIPNDHYCGQMPDIGWYEYCPPISVEEFNEHTGLLVYPNPTMNILHIEGLDKARKSQLSIFNLNGKIVYNEIILSNGNHSISLDISFLPSGIYIINWTDKYYKIVKF